MLFAGRSIMRHGRTAQWNGCYPNYVQQADCIAGLIADDQHQERVPGDCRSAVESCIKRHSSSSEGQSTRRLPAGGEPAVRQGSEGAGGSAGGDCDGNGGNEEPMPHFPFESEYSSRNSSRLISKSSLIILRRSPLGISLLL